MISISLRTIDIYTIVFLSKQYDRIFLYNILPCLYLILGSRDPGIPRDPTCGIVAPGAIFTCTYTL